MRYFAYCRKSSENDSHQAQSIETQIRILKEFSLNNNLDIADFIIETKSAKDDGNRPQFEEMLKRFAKKEAEGLLVCHIDRISRNWIEAGQISKLHDLGLIKEIRTPSKTYNTSADMFMMGIELASATYYSRNLSERVKCHKKTYDNFETMYLKEFKKFEKEFKDDAFEDDMDHSEDERGDDDDRGEDERQTGPTLDEWDLVGADDMDD